MVFLEFKERLEAWKDEAVDRLRDLRPIAIDVLSDRQNDIAEPLLAIAELAGSAWHQRLTKALCTVFKRDDSDDQSPTIMLLTDVQAAFDDKRAKHIASADLVGYLVELESRPWGEWKAGKPMTTIGLARQLGKHGIRPRQFRASGELLRGYWRSDFEDAWQRYCPVSASAPNESRESLQPLQPAPLLARACNDSQSGVVTSARVDTQPATELPPRPEPDLFTDAVRV